MCRQKLNEWYSGNDYSINNIEFKQDTCILHYSFVYTETNDSGFEYKRITFEDYPYKVSTEDAVTILLATDESKRLLQTYFSTNDIDILEDKIMENVILKQNMPLNYLNVFADVIMDYYEEFAREEYEEKAMNMKRPDTDKYTIKFSKNEGYLKEDYSKVTRDGYKIVRMYKDRHNDLYIIFKREYTLGREREVIIDYNIGEVYDLSDGTWLYGNYDFTTVEQAENYLFNKIFDKEEARGLKQIYTNDLDEDMENFDRRNDIEGRRNAYYMNMVDIYNFIRWKWPYKEEDKVCKQDIDDFIEEAWDNIRKVFDLNPNSVKKVLYDMYSIKYSRDDLDEAYHGSYFWEDDDEYEEAMEEDFISSYWEELEELTTHQEIEDFVQEHEEEVLEDDIDTDMLISSIMATFGIED